MAFEITGKLHQKSNTQQITESFSKREFVIEVSEQGANGMVYTNYVPLQLTNQGCAVLDNFALNSDVKVSFNIRGNRWEKDGVVRYITNLNAWKVEGLQAQAQAQAPVQPQFGDVPF